MRKASRDHLTEDYQAAIALADRARVVSPRPARVVRAEARPLRINLLAALESGWLECACGERWSDDGGAPRCPRCQAEMGIERHEGIFGTGGEA